MNIRGPGRALRICVGEADQWHGRPLYAAIVEQARAEGLAGATVTRGIMGFGANSRIHTASILRLSEDLPVVIDLVDSHERIARFLELVEPMVSEGLVATWDVTIELYGANRTEG